MDPVARRPQPSEAKSPSGRSLRHARIEWSLFACKQLRRVSRDLRTLSRNALGAGNVRVLPAAWPHIVTRTATRLSDASALLETLIVACTGERTEGGTQGSSAQARR
jgi:hypothetical protein